MDFEAGLPILVASLVAVLLFSWLQLERRAIAYNLIAYGLLFGEGRELAELTARLERVYARTRRVVFGSAIAAPTVMFFSGQLDAHGIAHVFDDALQVIAPFTSACFSAAVAWLLVLTPLVVHGTHCRLLDCIRCPRGREELW
jgi:uncharacterized membrane protein